MKNKFFKRLAVQTSTYFLLATIVAVIISALLLYSALSSIVMEQSIRFTKSSVENSGKYISGYLNKLDSISHSLATNPQIKRYIDCENDDEATLKKDVLSLIESSLMTDAYFASITLITKDGRIISTDKNLDMTLSSDMTQQSWYIEAVDCSGVPILTGANMTAFSSDKNTWVISMATEISDDSDMHLGVLLIDIDYLAIEDYIHQSDLGKAGYAFILDSDDQLVYHPDPNYFDDDVKQKELKAFADMSEGYEKAYNRLLHKYTIENEDWTLYGVASLDELAMIKVRMLNIFVLIGMMLLLTVFGVGIFMSRRITKPIRVLEEKMRAFDENFKQITLDKHACFEAQSLSHQFNEMVKTIQVLVKEVKYNEKSLKAYELNALRSQINPHFLYNTLDTIIWMAEFGDNKKVIELTKALAAFFRLSLSSGQELTTVNDEVNHARQYLFIQCQRYESMTYEISVEDAIGDVKIPKIILQPIVENAIYHGIRPKQGAGQITIHAFKKNNDLIFEISDNGVGFDKNALSDKSSRPVKLGGIGISNVDKRIKLEYGNKYGVTIDSKIGQGTTVTIKLKA
jgi:two-component system, sensor histidine kinase YesM